MKALIEKVEYKGQRQGNYGVEHNFIIRYDGKMAYYTAKTEDQKVFVSGQECEFIEEKKVSKEGKEYLKVKSLPKAFTKTGYAKEIKKEQSKYSGFAVSYAKDLCIAGKIDFSELPDYATVLFDLMVSLDKSIQND